MIWRKGWFLRPLCHLTIKAVRSIQVIFLAEENGPEKFQVEFFFAVSYNFKSGFRDWGGTNE
jgi:hypothetical protein